jgi:uncharacterized radical SAM superfamily Fe-S cluster-containing enzyme
MFKTFNGKSINENEISHQHLSNWFWYINLTFKEQYQDSSREYVQNLLYDRFDGEILDYKPHPKYWMEIDVLKRKNLLKDNGDIVLTNTIFNHKIGEVTDVE